MTFRQTVLALAAPVLSLAFIGCQPPLEEKKDGGAGAGAGAGAGTSAPTATDSATHSATPAPAPADAKPADTAPAATPSAEPPKDATAPSPGETKKDETPKS